MLSFALFFLSFGPVAAQEDSTVRKRENLIQFTGIILTPDSLIGVPNVNIRIAGTRQGTNSNDQGFFSLVAVKGDTIHFSAVGYKSEKYVVPSSLPDKKYSMIQTMSQDTIYLNEVYIKPYISKELFQHYFVTLEIPEGQGQLESMDPETLRQMASVMKMDGAENSKYYIRQETGKYYYTGQMPPINLMNPFAWAQFIKSWKSGKLKRQND
jgi:hypothetical protein